MDLKILGWDSRLSSAFEEYQRDDYVPLRVTRDNRKKYSAIGETGEYWCEVSGRFRHSAVEKSGYPVVGDWVAVTVRPDEKKGTIHAILPRKNRFSRKVAGDVTEEQVIAANIDTVFIVTGLDENFNLRRIERYLSVAWDSGITPVILLNKSDICPEYDERVDEVESIAIGTDVLAVSALESTGIDLLAGYVKKGRTVAFLGSSGVGKSTIINSLLGTEYMKVNEVNEVGSRGRHTTTHRELIVLPDGGMVIDTPGMRELQVWGEEEGLKQVFDDIERLAESCRFRDCNHESEPGCAVREALETDVLSAERFESYLKLKKEYEYLANRQTMKPSAIEKSKWKDIKIFARHLKNQNPDKNR